MNTPQETFDITLFALRKQGKASIGKNLRGNASCKYRGNGGCKCAAGHHMPDAVYTENVEGKIPRNLQPQHFPLVPKQQYELLRAMQIAHDSELAQEGMDVWELKMASIARVYNVNYKV